MGADSPVSATLRIDGLRIDTVKHVRKDFWPAFTASSGVYTVGEVLDGSVDYCAPYTEVMDGILNYPVRRRALPVHLPACRRLAS